MITHRLFIIILCIYSSIAGAQSIKNGRFDATCNSEDSLPCFWKTSWGGKDCCSLNKNEDNPYLSLVNIKEDAVAFVEQPLTIEETKEIKIIKLSGKVKTMEVFGKGASLHLQLFNSKGDYITKKDMGGSQSATWITGDTKWQDYSIQIICPIGVSKINVGAILQGQGTAHFDDFEINIYQIEEGTTSVIAQEFMKEVADIVEKHSLYRDSLNINDIRKKAMALVGNAQTKEDCHIGIDYFLAALQQYGDHHSFFMPPKEAFNWKEGDNTTNPAIKYPYVKRIGNIGYIYVPGCHTINSDLILAYADSLQTGLRQSYNDQLKGWIVDLRPNDGGNTEPMVMGLGPLLDQGYLGSLVDVNGVPDRWYYQDGSVFWEEEKGETLKDPYILPKNLPIAVLTGASTGSSGEIATISFIDNTLTKSFGQTTMGLTTGNGNFDLSDGSVLFIASTRMSDRNGNIFFDGVTPNSVINILDNPEIDLVLEAAKAWILNPK